MRHIFVVIGIVCLAVWLVLTVIFFVLPNNYLQVKAVLGLENTNSDDLIWISATCYVVNYLGKIAEIIDKMRKRNESG